MTKTMAVERIREQYFFIYLSIPPSPPPSTVRIISECHAERSNCSSPTAVTPTNCTKYAEGGGGGNASTPSKKPTQAKVTTSLIKTRISISVIRL